MKRITFYLLLLFAVSLKAQPPSFKFIPDFGLRIDCVAIADAVLINDTLFLFYNHELFNGTQGKGVGIATQSSDWLVFDTSYSFFDFEDYFIRYKMPDNTYRKYHPEGNQIKSESSITGLNFIPDTGNRYIAQPFDSSFGVSTYITASDGSVHLFYNTTGQEKIACRHAVSAPGDNGMNFNYMGMNVFGDSAYTTGNFFVDPNAIFNPDGSISVYLMNQAGGPFPPAGRTGYIHSFTSYDNGQTFSLDSDESGDTIRFKFDDFEAGYGFPETVYSLNDPKVVRLPDGRYRVYVSAMLKDSAGSIRYAIVSATSGLSSTVETVNVDKKVKVSPNPAKDYIRIESVDATKGFRYVIKDVKGIKIAEGQTNNNMINFDVSGYVPGVYFVEIMQLNNNKKMIKKIIKK